MGILTSRRALAVVAVVVSTGLAEPTLAPAAGAQSQSLTAGNPAACAEASPGELAEAVDDIHEHTNRERAAAGVAPVERLGNLDGIAQDWSAQMAASDTMRHNPDIRAQVDQAFPGQWRSYGENVLQNWCGASGEQLVAQWMRSPAHRVNLLNPAHTHLGVGAAVADSAKLYSTQNFVRLR